MPTFQIRKVPTREASAHFDSLIDAREHLDEFLVPGERYAIWEVTDPGTTGTEVESGDWSG